MHKALWPRLRPATNADGPQVMDLVCTILGEYGLQPDPERADADLKEAIRLYESYGFKPCRPEHLSCRCDQAYALDLTKS